MLFTDIFKLSLRMFKARTMRTMLTIGGMSLGIAAILFFVSLGYGLQQTVLQKITTADALVTLDITPDTEREALLDPKGVAGLKEIPGVADVAPALRLSSQMKYSAVTLDLDATATTPLFLQLAGTKPVLGTSLEDGARDQAVITTGVARTFQKPAEEMLGTTVSLAFFPPSENGGAVRTDLSAARDYRVTGIIESDENAVYLSLDSLTGIPVSRYNQLKVKCDSTDVMETVRENIIGKGYGVSSLSETVDQANKVFRGIQLGLMFFGIIALIVSAIGMFNTMTIALLERTEEIGIMKSLGASRFSISLMFVMESALMGFLGSLVGVALSYGAGELFNSIINLIASRFGGQQVDLFESPLWFVLSIIFFGALVGFLTGVFPARTASKIDPLDALRYK